FSNSSVKFVTSRICQVSFAGELLEYFE
ncbi:hypothetical protein SOVF_090580, partial [Spinacia oleracea]